MRLAVVAFAAVLAATPASAFFNFTGQPSVDPLADPGGSGEVQLSPIPRELVAFEGRHAPGTIVVSTSERRLYFVLKDGQAIRYGIGVGRPGFEWSGTKSVTRKAEWPAWTPPAPMLKRRPDLPRYMEGGSGQPARRSRDVSGRQLVPDPRVQRAEHDWAGGVVGLHPDEQRGCHRPVRACEAWHPSGRAPLKGREDDRACTEDLPRQGETDRRRHHIG